MATPGIQQINFRMIFPQDIWINIIKILSPTYFCKKAEYPYICIPIGTGSRGRAVRQRSAKPCTAVRIRSRPPHKSISV